MTFEPQHGFFSKNELIETGGAVYSNPDQFKLIDGVTKFIPDNYTGNTFSYNGGPWLGTELWCVDSSLDTWADLSTEIGVYTGITGVVEFEGSSSTQAVTTRMASAVTGNWTPGSYVYPTGNSAVDQYGACIGIGLVGSADWPCPADGGAGATSKQTYEFDVRAFEGDNSPLQDVDGIGLTGILYPSFVVTNTNTKVSKDEFVIIEPRPDGIRVHNQSGAFLPADMTSSSRRVRVAIDWGSTTKGTSDTDVIVALDNGSTLYVNDCGRVVDFTTTDHTAIFGCPPMFGGIDGPTFLSTPGASTFFNLAEVHDHLGVTGIAAFTGYTMWDNVKANLTEFMVNEPAEITPQFNNLASATIRTSSWKPNANVNRYVGAWVNTLPGSGNSNITIDVEYKYEADIYGTEAWTTSPEVDTLTISGIGSTTSPSNLIDKHYIDLSKIPVYAPPFQNELRFLFTATPTGFQPPSVDAVTVVGEQPGKNAEFHPNWKMSSLPQEIQVSVKEDIFYSTPAPKHAFDEIYFENEAGRLTLPVGEHILGANISGNVSGQVKSVLFPAGGGFEKTDNGYYDTPAWRNFTQTIEFTGSWSSDTYSYVSTGNFEGDLLDSYDVFPLDAGDFPHPGTSGIASVSLSVGEYEDLEGNLLNAQIVEIAGYTGDGFNTMGITLDTIGMPLGDDPLIAVVEGTIQIEKGPGVWVTLYERGEESRYYLNGQDFREPGSFGVASLMHKSHRVPTTGVYVSFSVDQRPSHPTGFTASHWTDWEDVLNQNDTDKFILYGVTGYFGDHSYLSYSGISGDHRIGNKLDDTISIHSGNSFSTFTDVVYDKVNSDSFLFETFIKPYGFTGTDGTSGMVFSCNNPIFDGSANVGITELWVHEDGHLEGITQVAVSRAAYGEQGHLSPIPITKDYTTGSYGTSHHVDGTSGASVIWGQWNHIGFAMEQLGMGDTMSGMDQPLLIGESENITHGARSSKLYITVNGKVAGSKQIGANNLTDRMYNAPGAKHGVLPYGTDDVATHAWPPLNQWSPSVSSNSYVDREFNLGKDVVAEWDHTRFSVRDRVDLYSDVIVNAAKANPPTFVPFDALKPTTPTPYGYEHMQFAHIYRFDYGSDNPYWDEGYAPSHMRIHNVPILDGEVDGYRVDREQFVTQIDGPKGRPAIRVGPGATLQAPLTRWDEYAFNGTGTYSHRTAAASYDANQRGSAAQLGELHQKTNANGRFAMAAHVKPYKYPEGDRVSDFFTVDEFTTDAGYAIGQLYMGVNSTGSMVFGTRNSFDDANDNNLGPFTGAVVPTGEWTHIGVEGILARSTESIVPTFMANYIGGEQDTTRNLNISSAGGAGAATGKSYAMSISDTDRGIMRVGGLGPVGATDRDWRYDYSDFGISELLFGYGFITETNHIDFARLASASGVHITGHAEQAYVDYSTAVGSVEGTGNAFGSPQTGGFVYPATSFTGAGQKMIWTTAAGGNSWEGLLKGGMALFGDGTFMNAHSYYAVYNGSEAEEFIGGTDSPIQFVKTVPDNGVNLALIGTKDWSSEAAISAFDLSDDSFANITHKIHGDSTVESFELIDQDVEPDAPTDWSALISTDIDSSEIRLSSYPIEGPGQHLGYFTHLIGGEERGIYIPGAFDHAAVTGTTGDYLSNVSKVKSSIKIKDSNGTELPFEKFPYDVILTPYSPDAQIDGLSGTDVLGFGNSYEEQYANSNGVFTVVLVAEYQTINDTVFIHYPSKRYDNDVINLQASDVYNPIPLMKEQIHIGNASGDVEATTGGFTVTNNGIGKSNTLYIWHGSLDV